jgi:hypothetical protein
VILRTQRTIGGAYYEYLPLEEAATGYRQLREIAAEVVSSPEQHAFWHPSWWPISSNAGGAWIAGQCDVAEDKPTPIRAISFVESTQFEPPVLASFGELIQHFINGLDQGVWRYDGDTGRWVKDFDRHTLPSSKPCGSCSWIRTGRRSAGRAALALRRQAGDQACRAAKATRVAHGACG